MMSEKSVVIIGGGLGGLFTGAILAKEGFRVSVLEKNDSLGGGLQSFKRFGEIFDTGMHVIGGMQKGGNVRRICNYLGLLSEIDILDVDENCSDKLYFGEDNNVFLLPKGRMAFTEYLCERFPQEKVNINNYISAIFRIADSIDLFNLRPSKNHISTNIDGMLISANDFIAGFVKDERLKSILAFQNPLYGGRFNETPAFVHALISVLYIKGTSRFVGGSNKFAYKLADIIVKNGGKVLTNEIVEWVEVVNRHVVSVKTNSGKVFRGDCYISSIHPCSLLKIMPEEAFPKAYRTRLNEIPNSYSAFSVYIKLKNDVFPYLNYSEYYLGKYKEIWHFGDVKGDWPKGFLFMTPPCENQGAFAKTVLVSAPMPFDLVRKWENTTVGKRGDEYECWKNSNVQKILDIIETLHPGFSICIDKINASSPLSIRDYYAVKEGAMSGYSKDYKNISLSMVPIVTKVDNLLLTGQNNYLHGFCGVPLTAVKTCEVLLGDNYIIDRINLCCEK